MSERDEQPFEVGARIEDLEIRERLGHGAFSVVYRAYDTQLHRDVALKVIRVDALKGRAEQREDILREARLVAAAASPHVVTLYKFRELAGNRWGFELEYLSGGTLADRLEREGTLEAAEARRVFLAILSALDAAHARGVVHHDVKPANVLLGDAGQVMLTDFGLGRIISDEDLEERYAGRARGTPSFMAPEVAMGMPATQASDLWSAGVMLYRMLAGRLPFPARDLAALFYAIQNAMPTPLGSDVSPYLASIALRCLAKAPEDRPPSAHRLLDELAGQRETSPAPPPVVRSAEASGVHFGRESEVERLHALAEEAVGGRGRTALILGEPGIGKTALAVHLSQGLKARGFRWLEARMSALEGLRRPLIQSIRRSLERQAESSGGSSGSRVKALTAQADQLLRRLQQAEDSDAREEALRSTWEIERAFLLLADEKPLAVLIEDIHLCRHDEIRTLAGLSASLAKQHVFLLFTWRTKDPEPSDPEQRTPSGFYDLVALENLVRIELGPLPDPAMQRLIENTADVPFVSREVLDRVMVESEGVPLYAVSLYEHFEAVGEIERVGDAVRPGDAWRKAEPPGFIRDMVRRRVSRLDEANRVLLETASVAGAEFDARVLTGLVGQPLLTTLRQLQQLYRNRALVEPLEHGYRFAHALYRDAIYGDLAPDLRRGLHAAWAEGLEQKAEHRPVDPALLGWHWREAGEPERARPHLRQAAKEACHRGELSRAWELADAADAFDERSSAERLRDDLDLYLSLGGDLRTRDGADALEALHERLRTAAAELGDEEMRRRVLVASSWQAYQRAGPEGVDAASLLRVTPEIEHPIARLEGWWLLSYLAKEERDHVEARRRNGEARVLAEATKRLDLVASLDHGEGLLLRQEGRLEEARDAFLGAADAHARASGPIHASLGAAMAAMVMAELGHPADAATHLAEPIRVLERGRQEPRAAHVMATQALFLRASGQVREANAILLRAEPIVMQGQYLVARIRVLLELFWTYALRGDLGRARETLGRLGTEMNDDADSSLLLCRALMTAIEGDLANAATSACRGLEGLDATQSPVALAEQLLRIAHLGLIGVDVEGVRPAVDAARAVEELPLFLALSLDVIRGVLDADDPDRLVSAADAAQDPRVGFLQGDTSIAGLLLLARAHLLRHAPDEAREALLEARRRARAQEHVWFELSALRRLRGAGLERDVDAERSVSRWMREQNPDDPERASRCLARWLPDPSG